MIWSEVVGVFVQENLMWLLTALFCFLVWFQWRQIVLGLKSRTWPSARGVVTDCYIDVDHDEDGSTSYAAKVAYRYEVAGRIFSGKRLQFGREGLWSSWRGGEQRLIESFPVGRRVPVFHHPGRPRLSTLMPGVSFWAWIFLVITIMAASWFAHLAWFGEAPLSIN